MSSDPTLEQAALRQVVSDLTELLESRWLRVLEWCELPVRIVRPGLGTVRVRLEGIRRRAQRQLDSPG